MAGNYGQVRDLTWRAADTLVFLDLPLWLVMGRLLRRTVKRALTKEKLWGTDNAETFRTSFLSRDSILLWALKTHRRNQRRFAEETGHYGDGRKIVRLQSPREVERFLAEHSCRPERREGSLAMPTKGPSLRSG